MAGKLSLDAVTTFNPFWSAASINENKTKKHLKKGVRWFLQFLKIAVYLFLTVIGLWGCTETFAQSWIATSPNVGIGLEIGYNYGTTGDFRYDLMSSGLQPYFSFGSTYTHWTMAYGPFYAWFVWPASQMVLPLMYATRVPLGSGIEMGGNTILSIFVLLLLIRIITISITLNSTLATERMTEIQGKVAEINARYKNATDPQSKRNKQLETMRLYKKHKIKSSAVFVQMFVTLPIFLIVYRIVTTLRPIKATILFNIWDLAQTPVTQIFSHFTDTQPGQQGWVYIFFLLLVIPIQFLSQRFPQWLAKKRNHNARTISQRGAQQYKKSQRIQIIFSVFIAIITAMSASGVGLYWFMNALFTILQSYLTHLFILRYRAHRRGSSKLDKILNSGE